MQARNEEQPDALFDPFPMVAIGIKGDMVTAKNNGKIRTRNYSDWKLLKHGCRQSATCDNLDDEDAFDLDEAVTDEGLQDAEPDPELDEAVANEGLQGAEQPNDSSDREQRWAIRDWPRRKTTTTKDSKYKDFICD